MALWRFELSDKDVHTQDAVVVFKSDIGKCLFISASKSTESDNSNGGGKPFYISIERRTVVAVCNFWRKKSSLFFLYMFKRFLRPVFAYRLFARTKFIFFLSQYWFFISLSAAGTRVAWWNIKSRERATMGLEKQKKKKEQRITNAPRCTTPHRTRTDV